MKAPLPPAGTWMDLEVTLSRQSVDILHELSRIGVLGATPEEVAARFIDEALRRFVEPPKWTGADLPRPRK